MSKDDQYAFAHKQTEQIPTRWSQIRSVTQRKDLLEQFVARECQRVGMPATTHARTLQTLNLGMCLGAFPAIHLTDDGQIDRIDGWTYDPDLQRFGFKKPKGKSRKPVETDEPLLDDHVAPDSVWVKPWLRLMRLLFRLPDDPTVSSSALPSVTHGPLLFDPTLPA